MELVYYYTQLLHPNKMTYNRISVATVDLVAFYYEQYPRLEELSLPIKTYLRTKDKKEFYVFDYYLISNDFQIIF